MMYFDQLSRMRLPSTSRDFEADCVRSWDWVRTRLIGVSMSKRLVELVYVSDSLLGDDPVPALEALSCILRTARARNALLEVTGLLLFNWTRFAQTLEGPQDAVDDVFASIRLDERHTNVSLIRRRERAVRVFARWPMACVVFDPDSGLDSAITLTGGGFIGQSLDTEALSHARQMADLLRDQVGRADQGRPDSDASLR